MVNPDIIKKRLLEMDENLKILVDLQKISKEDFIKDPKIFKLAERCLELCIQVLLDVCLYIIANNNWPRTPDNQGAISTMAQHKVIPEEFAKRIIPMAGFRNILVHEYFKIDPNKTYGHLQKLQDFREFQKYIIAYLKSL